MNSLDESSFAEVKAAIGERDWLASAFDVGEKYIRTRDRRVAFDFIGLRHNIQSVKSKAKILGLWVDEAEPVSELAWQTAIPTVREDGAEIWVTWNPARKKSATHRRFREKQSDSAKIIELNWRDNPFFPGILNRRRIEDFNDRPDSYDHVWEGGFVKVMEGAYYAKELSKAKTEGRIGHVARDPLLSIKAIFDIGGTGKRADACSIWIAQFVGREIRWLDYYEAQGQPLSVNVEWLRSMGYGNAICVLPHDGAHGDKVFDVSYESALRAAEFEVIVVPNQGPGAAMLRVEAARRLFGRMWFNEATTEDGREAIGWYHEKKSNDDREIGFGPEHDWSSHGADAFGLGAVVYEQPESEQRERRRRRSGGGWQGF
jgi:phage terminase large subunit